MERLRFEDFKVSIKSTNVPNTIASNRLLAERIDYPLHLGITEAGTKWSGSLKSAVGLGTLLADGVGDTIRISLSTFHAEEEVKVAWEILKALKLRERGPVLIACPTCGRLQFDMDTVVAEIEERLRGYDDPIEVAVLGCAVNGIGEASHADFGITGAKNEGLIFAHGKPLRKVPQDDLVDALFAEIDKSIDRGEVVVDSGKAAEGAAWLEKIEEENAGELTPERIAAMEAAAANEDALGGNGQTLPMAGARRRSGSRWTKRRRRRRGGASPGRSGLGSTPAAQAFREHVLSSIARDESCMPRSSSASARSRYTSHLVTFPSASVHTWAVSRSRRTPLAPPSATTCTSATTRSPASRYRSTSKRHSPQTSLVFATQRLSPSGPRKTCESG